MSAEKLSSDEVPKKFIEWLLDMGFPQEKLPSIDKIAQKCRGHYYMVWRNLMEHVRPKDEIREKRLKVFCDDVKLCQKKNVLNERQSNVVVPEQLQLWRQQKELHMKVANAESQVAQARQDLKILMDKVSSRISQRDISQRKVEDKQRRVWLLRQVSAELASRKTSLEETRDIANSLCGNTDDDLEGKVDKCLSLLLKPGQSGALLTSNSAASVSALSSHGDDIEEQLSTLSRARGDALWTQLCQRRAALAATLAHANATHSTHQLKHHKSSVQSVLAHTACLQCTLSLQTMKNRLHITQTRARVAEHIYDLNDMQSAECELLVYRSDVASAEARVRSQRTLLAELANNSGVFEVASERQHATGKHIADVDKAIEASRDELKRLIVLLATTERKILSTKEVLTAVFNSFQSDSPINRYKGIQLNFPQDSIATICQFYEKEQEMRRNKADLSMDFDTSDGSLDNTIDVSNPRFIDELRVYLKKFELEKNRKLVMESGEKIWIFESLQSSLQRLYCKWLDSDVSPLLCPSISLSRGIQKIITDRQTKETLDSIVKAMGCEKKLEFDIDIKEKKEKEEATIDAMKKKLSENLHSLQKSTKLLQLGQKNLQLWQEDAIKNCISTNRTINGKPYKEYEALYIENLSYNA